MVWVKIGLMHLPLLELTTALGVMEASMIPARTSGVVVQMLRTLELYDNWKWKSSSPVKKIIILCLVKWRQDSDNKMQWMVHLHIRTIQFTFKYLSYTCYSSHAMHAIDILWLQWIISFSIIALLNMGNLHTQRNIACIMVQM